MKTRVKKSELLQRGLPKWPALIVKGKPVTQEQAMEIIVRTDHFSFCSNDKEFEKDIHELIYGVRADWLGLNDAIKEKYRLKDFNETWEKQESLEAKYKILDLSYMSNHRILSSWIGGPHGWCDWNGYIGTNNYNIGKYPSVEEVYEDWKKIAKAFPYLELKSQLLNGETCEEGALPVVEFVVKNGKVKIADPSAMLDYPNNNLHSHMSNLFSPNRERGCTKEQLKNALSFVEFKNAVENETQK
jgi:hypothetical protein